MDKLEEAIAATESARECFRKLSNEEEIALCNIRLSDIYLLKKDYQMAYDHLLLAKYFYESKSDQQRIELANTGLKKILQSHKSAEFVSDVSSAFKSLRLLLQKPSESQNRVCNMWIADQLLIAGKLDDAIEEYKNCREVFEGSNMMDMVAICDMKIGEVFKMMDQFEKAIESYQKAWKQIREINNDKLLTACLIKMASVFQKAYKFDQAIELCNSARLIFSERKTIISEAETNLALGHLYLELGDGFKAIEYFQEARKLIGNDGLPSVVAKCDIAAGRAYKFYGNFEEAIKFLEGARKYYKEAEMDIEYASCEADIGSIYVEINELDKARECYDNAERIYTKEKLGEELNVWKFNSALIYEKVGRIDDALKIYEEHYRARKDQIGKVKALLGIGRIVKAKGKFDKAKQAFNRAVSIIDELTNNLKAESFRFAFLNRYCSPYFEMLDILIDEKNFESALEYLERLKSRNLIERFQVRSGATCNISKGPEGARSYFPERQEKGEDKARIICDGQSDHESRLEKDFRKVEPNKEKRIHISYGEIKELVKDTETALIEMLPLEDKTVIFIILKERKLQETTLVIKDYNRMDLIKDVDELLAVGKPIEKQQFQSEAGKEEWNAILEDKLGKIYNKMFLKIEPYLKGIKKIIFIPYSWLHLIPLHALFGSCDGQRRYLIDDYIISYAPSAAILQKCEQSKARMEDRVFVGNSSPEGTVEMPFIGDETRAIRELFKTAQIIDKVTKRDFIECAKGTSIIHYSGHANYRSMILHDERDSTKKQEYTFEDIYASLELDNVFLATLSACETGVTEAGWLDEYFGLASGFLCAGAATVISSLWGVRDHSTSLLMRKMYSNLKAGLGKAEALREAQVWLKNPANGREQLRMLSIEGAENNIQVDFSHPYYWAGFICSGVN